MSQSPGGIRNAVLLAASSGIALACGCTGLDFARTGTGSSSSSNSGGGPGDPGSDENGGGFVVPDSGGFLDASCPPEAPIPEFGTPVTCAVPPPPISGGTLLVTHDGSEAIAADPDRDAVYVVDLASATVKFTIALQPGDEPGRLAEDGAGRIHVALRGSGTLATLDPTSGTVTSRRAACPAPRGVAWQASNDVIWVACATGELVSLPAAGGGGTVQRIQRDLRDILVNGDDLAVTQFRSAQVLRLAADKTVARTDAVAALLASGVAPQVMWRAVAGPSGAIVAVHQAESIQSLATMTSGGYGGCGGLPFLPPAPPPLVGGDGGALLPNGPTLALPSSAAGAMSSVITVIGADGQPKTSQPFPGVLPVDVASAPDGSFVVAIAAGSGSGPSLVSNLFQFGQKSGSVTASLSVGSGPAIAVAIEPNNSMIVQTREPAALVIVPALTASSGPPSGALTTIALSTVSRADTGHEIFHTHAGSLIACASCHPEGGDDGHVWVLDGAARRTPSLRGTIAGTAPYHWPGDEADFAAIVNDVYRVRMNGGDLSKAQVGVLNAWVESIPAPPAPSWVDMNAAAAGRAIFERTDVGCAKCHSGSKFTNNATLDVGTKGMFQVPPLVGVGWRTPLMHDGCAATIGDRFGVCSTPGHGNIATLSTQDVSNLTAYLETL